MHNNKQTEEEREEQLELKRTAITRKNPIGITLTVVAVFPIVIYLVFGFIIAEDVEQYRKEMNWAKFWSIFSPGLIGGILLIDFAEVIYLLDSIRLHALNKNKQEL